jgi:hypothetical protein
MNSTFTHELANVPPQVGMRSLVGIGGREFPLSFGNYFALVHADVGAHKWDGWRINNFWAENLTEAAKRFLQDNLVRVQVWRWTKDGKDREGKERTVSGLNAIIDDARIPAEWYHNKMCWTGGALPPLEVAQQMYAVRGDATNELEMWTNPVSYYAKRGGEYKDGFIRYNIPRKPA